MKIELSVHRGMDRSDVVRHVEAYRVAVQALIDQWVFQRFMTAEAALLERDEHFLALDRLCSDPKNRESRSKFDAVAGRLWDLEDEFSDSEDEEFEVDPWDEGFYESWVWEFRDADPSKYEQLRELRERELKDAEDAYRDDPGHTSGSARDRALMALQDTEHLIDEYRRDPEALAKMFDDGDSAGELKHQQLEAEIDWADFEEVDLND